MIEPTVHSMFAPSITPPNESYIKHAQEHQNQLTKPTGSLGDLENIACWLAGIQKAHSIQSRPAALLLFAADHPISHHGVSAYPREVTGAMIHNILSAGAASTVLCQKQNLPLYVWDVGVDSPYEVPGNMAQTPSQDSSQTTSTIYYKQVVSEGQVGNLFESDAMDEICLMQCLQTGRQAIDLLADDHRIVMFGEMGIGNTTPAAAISAALLGVEAKDMVGMGTGVVATALQNKIDLVQQALDRCSHHQSPLDLLRCLGGREITAMVSAMQRSAERGFAIWVDGFIVTAAALMACRINPAIRPYMYFAHQSAERGHRLVLDALEAQPLINCHLRLGEGTGALTAFPLLELAVTLHTNMATFATADVPDRES